MVLSNSEGMAPERFDVAGEGPSLGNRIVTFLEGKNVLVTGATGFLGKVLVEKLWRSCRDIGRIYVVLRLRKRDTSLEDRVKNILNSLITDALDRDALARKIHPISGDMGLPGLGICDEDRELLRDSVNIVFHCAATVRFTEPLRTAVRINLRGTRDLLDLARTMNGLEAFVHVSTAYANSENLLSMEKFYPQRWNPTDVINLCEWIDDELEEKFQIPLVGNKPNTYVFTKALGESLLLEYSDLPISCVRPSIIISALKEPRAGYSSNLNGPNFLLIGVAHGVLHTFLADPNMVTDMIPVDHVSNVMIASAWKTAVSHTHSRRVPPLIYHATSGTQNPLHWRDIRTIGMEYLAEKPFVAALWYPSFHFRTSRFINDLLFEVTLHWPALLLALKDRLMGKRNKVIDVYNTFKRQKGMLEYFSSREFTFVPGNSLALREAMTEEEQEMFYFDVREINWPKFFKDNFDTFRKEQMKREDIDADPALKRYAVRKSNIFYILHRLVCSFPLFLCFFVVGYFLLSVSSSSTVSLRDTSSLSTESCHYSEVKPFPHTIVKSAL